MGCKFSRSLRQAGLSAVLLAAGSAAVAAPSDSASAQGLAGTWMVEVTLRNCDTGAALGPAFPSLVTFHRGGTITESPGTLSFAPGQRTDGMAPGAARGATPSLKKWWR